MGDAVSRLLSAPAAAPVVSDVPEAQPAPEEPTWKRVLSNICGREFPVCRIEGRYPRKFPHRTLENVEVQRWLGSLLPLWPHFPGGMDFSKDSGRLVLDLEGQWGEDAARAKRLAAAVGAVLEANADGSLRRIAVADPEFEKRLENPPRIIEGAAPRPSMIDDQSVVVSGSNQSRRAPFDPNYKVSIAVTALWVVLVAALGGSNMRDEEIAWLCVGAIASVYLLPRVPLILAWLNRAVVWVIVVLCFLVFVPGVLFLGLSVDEPEVVYDSGIVPAPQQMNGTIARVEGDPPANLTQRLMADGELHMWIMRHLPFAGRDGAYAAGFSIADGDLSLEFRDAWVRGRLEYHATNREENPSARLFEEQQAILHALSLAAKGWAPASIRPVTFANTPWSDGLRVSVPHFESMETNRPGG